MPDKSQTDLINYAQDVKNLKLKLETERIMKLYQEDQIDRDYAVYLLKKLIEDEEEIFLENEKNRDEQFEILNAIIQLTRISIKNKELFEYLELLAISDRSIWIQINCLILLSKHFPKKCKRVINEFLKGTHSYFLSTIKSKFNKNSLRYFELRELSHLIERPIYKIYLYYKWFFDKYGIWYNEYQNRIFGSYKLFHGNLRIKIQCYSSPNMIMNDTGIEILKEFDLNYLESQNKGQNKVFTTLIRRDIRVLDVFPINERYFYGISLRVYNKILKSLKRLFEIKNEDFFLYFIKNKTITYLYIDIPILNVEIVIPAKRIKKDD